MIGVPGLVTLGAYTLVLSIVAPTILRRCGWVVHAPRLAVVLWQALSAAWLLSLLLLDLALAGPTLEHLAWPNAWPAPSTGDLVGLAVGVALGAGLLVRVGYILGRELTWVRRRWRAHAEELAFAGEAADWLGATVLEHATPAVYCLPGRDRRTAVVVVSTGAIRLLGDAELAAVIAHEHGHLRLHHHRITAIAGALRLAFPCVPLLKAASEEIEILAEMAADDHARRHHDPHALAAALLTLAKARAPEYALGAAGHTVTSRLIRMLAPARSLAAPKRIAPTATAAGAITLPLGVSCTTVFAAATVLVGRLLS